MLFCALRERERRRNKQRIVKKRTTEGTNLRGGRRGTIGGPLIFFGRRRGRDHFKKKGERKYRALCHQDKK